MVNDVEPGDFPMDAWLVVPEPPSAAPDPFEVEFELEFVELELLNAAGAITGQIGGSPAMLAARSTKSRIEGQT